MCLILDEMYLYCWGDTFISTLPWKVTNNLRCISAYQVTENLCRVLVCEKLMNCFLLEVYRLPSDPDKPRKGKLNEELFKLDLEQLDDVRASIMCAKLYEGKQAFIATDKGLVRWQFLEQWKPDDGKWIETYDTLLIENEK